MLWEALWQSINAIRAQLDMYNLEVWSILHEWDTCTALVKELEEVLAVEESADEEVEMREEKARYDAKRGVVTQQEVIVKGHKDEGEGKGESEGVEEEDEDEDKPMCSSGLSAKAKGKHLAL